MMYFDEALKGWEVWYRYEEVFYARSLDEWGEPYGESALEIRLYQFRVSKHTPKGVWINWYGDKKFILRDATKRFACPTRNEAWESLKARKTRQLGILHAQAKRVQRVLDTMANKQELEVT